FVVSRLARWTGCKAEVVAKAAAKEFNGYPKVVAKLRTLDGRQELQELYQLLIDEHPEIAKKIGLTRALVVSRNVKSSTESNVHATNSSSSTVGKQKRRRKRGRPSDTDSDADRRLAEAWETGNYNTYEELATAKGFDQIVVKRAIDRNRKRRGAA